MRKISDFTVRASGGNETFSNVYDCMDYNDILEAFLDKADGVIITKDMKKKLFWNSAGRALSAIGGKNTFRFALGSALGDDEYIDEEKMKAYMDSIRYMIENSRRKIELENDRVLHVYPKWGDL